jgi:uncharacterized membrane protein
MARGRNELERGGGLSKSIKAASFIPRSRLEALTDGVFAFAMTLLVVNIELPKGFHPKTNEDLLSGLANLSDTFIAYLITFFVLVSFWFGRAKEDGEPEMASAAYAWAVLIHLLSVTFLPFSLLAVGRYDVPAAAWVYGANMILLALSALAISLCAERDTGRARLPSGRVELCILIASAVLSIAVCSRRHTPCFPIFSILPLHSRHSLCMGDSRSKCTSVSVYAMAR